MKFATIGRIVHYNLSASDIETLNGRSGPIDRFKEGETYPAIVVKTCSDTPQYVNLQVFLNGEEMLWIISRIQDLSEDQKAPPMPGTWKWPCLT